MQKNKPEKFYQLFQKSKGKTQRFFGFSLIELLVVISIIGFLASLLLVAMSSALLQSRDARVHQDLTELLNVVELARDTHNANFGRITGSWWTAGNGTCDNGQNLQNIGPGDPCFNWLTTQWAKLGEPGLRGREILRGAPYLFDENEGEAWPGRTLRV